MRTSNFVLACAIAMGELTGRAAAQEPAAPEATTSSAATAPEATTSPAATAPEAATPSAASAPEAASIQLDATISAACVPNCRSGYTCSNGTCVSSCNPPCNIGDVCTSEGECMPRPAPPPAHIVPVPAAAGTETHDGFFLRLTTGPAGGAISLDIPDSDEVTYSGGGWSTSIDIGGAPVRDLVIFGRLRGAWIFDPKVRRGDTTLDTSDNLIVTQSLLGAGINYYLMPSNIYFGGAIGFATIGTSRDRGRIEDERRDSDVGFGIDLDAGKEWWVGDNWGIGVALRLSLASVPAGDDIAADDAAADAVFGSGFVSLLFSATYQ